MALKTPEQKAANAAAMRARLTGKPADPLAASCCSTEPWQTVAQVAGECGLSRRQVTRLFENELGVKDCGQGRYRYLMIPRHVKERKFADLDCGRPNRAIISTCPTRARRRL